MKNLLGLALLGLLAAIPALAQNPGLPDTSAQVTAAIAGQSVAPGILNNTVYAGGITGAGVGHAQVAWASGTSFSSCATVSSGGANYIAVAPSIGVTPGTNSAVWYPVSNANTATAGDCAFYIAASEVSGATGSEVILPPGNTNLCIGWMEPTVTVPGNPVVAIRGAGGHESVITGTCTGVPVLLEQPPTTTAFAFAHDDWEGFSPNGNFLSIPVEVYGSQQSRFVDMLLQNPPDGSDHYIQFGDTGGSTHNFGWVFEPEVEHIDTSDGHAPGTGAALTVAVSGGALTFTVTAGGSGYTNGVNQFNQLVLAGSGAFADVPCTTRGTDTITVSGGAVTSVTSTASGCTGPIVSTVFGGNRVNKGISFQDESDSKDIVENTPIEANTGIFISGISSQNYFAKNHPTATYIGISNAGNNVFVGNQMDSIYRYGFDFEGASYIATASATDFEYGSNVGSTDYHFGTITNSPTNSPFQINIYGDICGNAPPGGNYFHFIAANGGGNSFIPSFVHATDTTSCDTLTFNGNQANYIGPWTGSGNVTAGGEFNALGGQMNVNSTNAALLEYDMNTGPKLAESLSANQYIFGAAASDVDLIYNGGHNLNIGILNSPPGMVIDQNAAVNIKNAINIPGKAWVYASQVNGGTDACAAINAAGATLPSVGGIIDAYGLGPGTFTCTTALTATNNASQAVTLLLGQATILVMNQNLGHTVSPANCAVQVGPASQPNGASSILVDGHSFLGGNNFQAGAAANLWGVVCNGSFTGSQESMKIDGVSAVGNSTATIGGALMYFAGLFSPSIIINSGTNTCFAQCLMVASANGSVSSGGGNILFINDTFRDNFTGTTSYPGSVVGLDTLTSSGGLGNISFIGGLIEHNGPHNPLLTLNGRGGTQLSNISFVDGIYFETLAATVGTCTGCATNVDPIQITDANQIVFSALKPGGSLGSGQTHFIDIATTDGAQSTYAIQTGSIAAGGYTSIIHDTIAATDETGFVTGGEPVIPPYMYGGAVPFTRYTNYNPPAESCSSLTIGSLQTNSTLSGANLWSCETVSAVPTWVLLPNSSGSGGSGPTSGTVAGDVVTFDNTTGGLQDSGTALSSLAPLASPNFTTPSLGAAAATSLAVGTSPPSCTAGTAGADCLAEGTAPTNASGTTAIYADSTQHELMAAPNGSSNFGILNRTVAHIIQTGQTASISTATLCAASAGSCNVAGQYEIEISMIETGTACTTPGSPPIGTAIPSITWTDTNGTTHSGVIFQMNSQNGSSGSAIMTSNGLMFQSALTKAGASGTWIISTNGTVIQYAVAYMGCSSGTGTYQVEMSVTRLH
jgi:hypothetical protein